MAAHGRHPVAPADTASRSALFGAAKFLPPRLPGRLVARPRLDGRLESAATARVTVVCGPAGAGKSNLVASFVARRTERCSWLTFDDRDDDLAAVWADLSYAFDRLFAGARLGRPAARADAAEQLLRSARELGNEAIDDCFLVLDALDVLDRAVEHEVLTHLADALPPSVHLVVVSRRHPQLPVHRWRAGADVVEVSGRDLRFTIAEASELLGSSTASADLETIVEHSEGWATGLLLTRRGNDTPAEAERRVREFLFAEVLERESPATRQFLLEAACLQHLTAGLCEHVTGRADSAELLRDLARGNAFVAADTSEWGCYELHRQFRAMLRDELRARDPRRAAAVLVTGARWYEQQGDTPAAIEQWLDAGCDNEALLLLRHACIEFGHTRPDLLRTWTDRIAPAAACEQPALLLDLAVACSLAGDDVRARDLAERVDDLLRTTDDRVTTFGAELLRARLAVGAGDVEQHVAALEAAQRLVHADATLTDESHLRDLPLARHLSAWHALGRSWLERKPNASAVLRERPHAASEDTPDRVLAWGVDAVIALARGDLDLAAAQASRASAAAHASGITGYCAWPGEHALAALLHEQADITDAREAYETLTEATSNPPGNTFSIASQVGLAMVLRTQGELAEALERLSRIRRDPTRNTRATTQRWIDRGTILTLLRLGQVHAAREVLGPPPWGLTDMRVAALIALAEGRAGEAERLSSPTRVELPRPRLFAAIVATRVALLRGDRDAAAAGAVRTMRVAQEHHFVRSVLDFGDELIPEFAAVATTAADAEFVARLREATTLGTAAIDDRQPGRASIGLSGRELDVLRYLATPLSTREIAQALHVSRNTVKSHQQHVYRKLDVGSRAAAVARARSLQLLR